MFNFFYKKKNSKKKKEKEKIQASIEKLKNELIQQEENHKRVLEALEKEKNWLINCKFFYIVILCNSKLVEITL